MYGTFSFSEVYLAHENTLCQIELPVNLTQIEALRIAGAVYEISKKNSGKVLIVLDTTNLETIAEESYETMLPILSTIGANGMIQVFILVHNQLAAGLAQQFQSGLTDTYLLSPMQIESLRQLTSDENFDAASLQNYLLEISQAS